MKRSHAVVAMLAAATVGGTAYSMMPSERCQRSDGGAALDPSAPACRSDSGRSGGSGGSGWHSSRSYFGSSGDSNASSGSSSSSSTSAGGTQRGGFGGFFSSLGSRIAS